jgi:DNA-3-methyladenine glycosylase II
MLDLVNTVDQAAEAASAREHLIGVDRRLGEIVRSRPAVNPYVWEGVPVPAGELLAGLVLHIVAQQISTVVALALYDRIESLLGGTITAESLAAAKVDQFRSLGLSTAKGTALRELGERVRSGGFSLQSLCALDDDAAQAQLVSLRGVGPWSAQMFLLHELKRPDVFPAGDVALRRAVTRLDALAEPLGIRQTGQRASVWSPYRSYAAAYLWSWLRGLREIERARTGGVQT